MECNLQCVVTIFHTHSTKASVCKRCHPQSYNKEILENHMFDPTLYAAQIMQSCCWQLDRHIQWPCIFLFCSIKRSYAPTPHRKRTENGSYRVVVLLNVRGVYRVWQQTFFFLCALALIEEPAHHGSSNSTADR